MTSTTTEHFRTEILRIRKSVADAFREHKENEKSGRWVAQPLERRHVVPSRLRILDVMEGDLAVVSPESPLPHALTLMIENRISSAPVVDANGRIVGALNEKDLMPVFYQPDANCVAAVMTRNPVAVSIDAPLVDVVDHLMSSDFRRVLIHDDDRLLGVITRSHLMPALLEALEERAITRESFADAFRDHTENEGSRRWGAQPLERRHVVPSRLRILDVMEGDLAVVSPESPLPHALTLMIENRISSVPVVDANGRIVGALNEKDLMPVFYQPDANCVAAVMTRNPVAVSIDAPLVDVVDRLMSSDFRRVLIHENHRLLGVITRSHLMPALLEALEERAITRESAPEPHERGDRTEHR
jgi:CBS domain-containing protein